MKRASTFTPKTLRADIRPDVKPDKQLDPTDPPDPSFAPSPATPTSTSIDPDPPASPSDLPLETPLARAHRIAESDHRVPNRKPKKHNKLDPNILPWDIQPFETLEAYRAFEIYLHLGSRRTLAAVERAVSLKQKGRYKEIFSYSKSEFTEQLIEQLSGKQLPHKTESESGLTPSEKLQLNEFPLGVAGSKDVPEAEGRSAHKASARGPNFERNRSKMYSNWSRFYLWGIRVRAWDAHLANIKQQQYESDVEHMNKLQARRFARMQEIAEEKLQKLADSKILPTWRDVISLMTEGAKGERIARGLGMEVAASTVVSQTFNLSGLSTEELETFIQLHSKLSSSPVDMAALGDGSESGGGDVIEGEFTDITDKGEREGESEDNGDEDDLGVNSLNGPYYDLEDVQVDEFGLIPANSLSLTKSGSQ